MGTNEDYLDNLLRAAMESEEKMYKEEPEPIVNEPEAVGEKDLKPIEIEAETTGETVGEEPQSVEEESQSAEEESQSMEEESQAIEDILKMFQEEPQTVDEAPEESVVLPGNDERNVAAEEIIAEKIVAEENVAGEAAAETIVPEMDGDPNRQLTADEIAAMFAMMDAADPGEAGQPENEATEPEMQEPEAPEPEIIPETLQQEETRQPEPEQLIAAQQETEQPEEAEELEIDLSSVDDLDSLLGLRELPADHYKDDKAEEEQENISPKNDQFEGQDVTELLDLLGDDDSELAEINELLKKSDRNEMVDDDDMLAMLAGISDLEGVDESEASVAENGSGAEQPEEKTEEKPKKKKWGRKKKKSDEETAEEKNTGAEETSDAVENADSEEKEKKTGFFGKLLQALTEEDEEEEEEQPLEPGIEGEQIEAAPVGKKGKKDKKKKGKKPPETNEEILEELSEEDAAKAKNKKKKEKKPKKEKKQKKEKQPVIEEPSKKLPKKMIIRIFVLCFSLLAVILVVAIFLPGLLQIQSARKQFYSGNYEEAYQSLVGQNLSESDQILLQKAEMIVRLERKADAYRAYRTAGDEKEALNALLEGVAYYWQHDGEYDSLGIREDMERAYMQLVVLLETEYSISEERAKEIVAMDSISYTYEIRSLVGEGGEPSSQTGGETGQEPGSEAAENPAAEPEGASGEMPAGNPEQISDGGQGDVQAPGMDGAPEGSSGQAPEEPSQDAVQKTLEDPLEEELD